MKTLRILFTLCLHRATVAVCAGALLPLVALAQYTGGQGRGDVMVAFDPPSLFDCPLLGANVGDPCDDGDACTENDVLNTTCACVGTPLPDSDGDGLCDDQDGCPNDPDKTEPGICGCGVADVPTTWYIDSDGDGFGNDATATPGFTCAPPSAQHVQVGGDCNDAHPAVFPGAVEICDGIDNNCDGAIDDDDPTVTGGSIWYADADGDGYGDASNIITACSAPEGYVANSDDCNDSDPAIFPGAEEICDGIDNNCDGAIDDDDPSVVGQSTWYADADGDGFGDASNSITACTAPSGYVANSGDCNDGDPLIFPGAEEVCDGIDNNCTGLVDDADPAVTGTSTWYADIDGDGFGDAANSITACTAPAGYVANSGDCNDSDPVIFPGAEEICDGIDNNCNGLVDDQDPAVVGQSIWYADMDGDGFGDASNSITACAAPVGYVANSGDCNDSDPAIFPGAVEICDGIDNNCNGLVDYADPAVTGTSTWYADADGDGYGDPADAITSCNQPAGYVANSDDTCPAVAGVTGSSCNDGDPETGDDVLNEDCICMGLALDCAGIAGGGASLDDCGVCSGGSTGISPNSTCTFGQSLQPNWWQPNGAVNAILEDIENNTVYIGGNFDHVGPNIPHGAKAALDGSIDMGIGSPNGAVYASIPDGSGGWFIGGAFTMVNGQQRRGVARLNSDGSLHAWDPDLIGTVHALHQNGGSLYIGGSFSAIGGELRRNVAVVDVNTGVLQSSLGGSLADTPSGVVRAIHGTGSTVYVGGDFTYCGPTVNHGARITTSTGAVDFDLLNINGAVHTAIPDGAGGWFIGGDFTMVGGQNRNRLARINADGTVHPWDPGANDRVTTMALNGTTLYVGGFFNELDGQPRLRLGAIDGNSGNVLSWMADVNWTVSALAVGSGVLYVGGNFSTIGGQDRQNLAAVNLSTGVVTAWAPSPNSSVFTLAINGSTIYAGGSFTSIGGQTRSNIAALDASSGLATSWNPSANGGVFAMVISGTTIYAGGNFTNIGGQNRNRIAALNTGNNLATTWDPNANDAVYSLVSGPSVVYAGGIFTSIGGQPRQRIAALATSNGAATTWAPNADDTVLTMAVSGSTIYVGGYFRSLGGRTRNRIAELNIGTGSMTTWDPNANNSVRSLAVAGPLVYVGGGFTNIGGQSRSYIAALNTSNGLATTWVPNANNHVYSLSIHGTLIYAGGFFSNIGGQVRGHIAAVSTTTGLATSWDPGANNPVLTLFVNGSTVYAGGQFTSIGGQSRNRLAAVDAGTALANSWNPNASGQVWTVSASGSGVYAGGTFLSIGGVTRQRLAALNATTGTPLDWDPNPSSIVRTLALGAGIIYVGGDFTSIGGQTRNRLAAFNAVNGSLVAWDPNVNSMVACLAVDGQTVYAGGSFTTVGGQTRNRIAALNATSGVPTNWNPDANNTVLDLVTDGTKIYASGSFGTIGGASRNRLAALDETSGLATAWNPNSSGVVESIALGDSLIYVTGSFSTMNGQARNSLAAFDRSTGDLANWNPNAGSGKLRAVEVDGNAVYAGGGFSTLGSLARRNLASMDVSTAVPKDWTPNPNGNVNCILATGTRVYVGGSFSTISDQSKMGFAVYSVCVTETFYADIDGDGYGDPNNSIEHCAPAPAGYVSDNTDCNDADASIYPGALEICDGIDNSCNGLMDDEDPSVIGQATWYADADGDGFGDPAISIAACSAPLGHVSNGDDCDDTNASIHPGAVEICDGIDNNCNGLVDDQDPEVSGKSTWYADADGDGFGDPSVSIMACFAPVGYVSNSSDCNDGDPAVFPGAAEICDGIDNNCTGLVDDQDPGVVGQGIWYADADGDGFGDPTSSVIACAPPVGYVANNTDCNDSDASIHPDAEEFCDGIDNNCNGLVDDEDPAVAGQSIWYADADGDGFGDPFVSILACSAPNGFVSNNSDCDDADAYIHPDATEVCDGIDNNCNGLVDDEDPSVTGQPFWYADVDNDGLGDPADPVQACAAPEGYVANSDDPCPQAVDGISNFDVTICECMQGFDPEYADHNGVPVITACNSTCEPGFETCPSDQVFELAAGSCAYVPADGAMNATLFDCSTATATTMLSGATTGGPYADLSGVELSPGETQIIWSVTNAGGSSSTCEFTVEITDNTPPVAICHDLTLQLEADGTGTLTAAMVDNGSTDNCMITGMAVSPNTFTCADLGAGGTEISGPMFPAPGGTTATGTGNNGQTGGRTLTYTAMDPALMNGSLYWGKSSTVPVQLSMDGGSYTGAETMTFQQINSNTARWTGASFIRVANGSGGYDVVPVDTRFTLVATTISDAPISFQTPGMVDPNFPSAADAIVSITGEFKINMLFEAYYNGGWHPARTLFNDLQTDPNTSVASSFGGAFYVVENTGIEVVLTVSDAAGNSATCTAMVTVISGDADGDGIADCDDECPLIAGENGDSCDPGPGFTGGIIVDCLCEGTPVAQYVDVSAAVVLDGAYDPADGRMRDDLRALSLIPSLQPYSMPPFNYNGTETVDAAVLANAGLNDAIVDWVLLELRDATTSTTVIATRAALVRRDGMIVDTDGTSAARFNNVSAGNYRLAIRHRNHIGVITANSYALGVSTTLVDLRIAGTALTQGAGARKAITEAFPTLALWAGDASSNGVVNYFGTGPDRQTILNAVGSATPFATLNNVYHNADVNMNGTVNYFGTGPDRQFVLNNVGSATPFNQIDVPLE